MNFTIDNLYNAVKDVYGKELGTQELNHYLDNLEKRIEDIEEYNNTFGEILDAENAQSSRLFEIGFYTAVTCYLEDSMSRLNSLLFRCND